MESRSVGGGKFKAVALLPWFVFSKLAGNDSFDKAEGLAKVSRTRIFNVMIGSIPSKWLGGAACVVLEATDDCTCPVCCFAQSKMLLSRVTGSSSSSEKESANAPTYGSRKTVVNVPRLRGALVVALLVQVGGAASLGSVPVGSAPSGGGVGRASGEMPTLSVGFGKSFGRPLRPVLAYCSG